MYITFFFQLTPVKASVVAAGASMPPRAEKREIPARASRGGSVAGTPVSAGDWPDEDSDVDPDYSPSEETTSSSDDETDDDTDDDETDDDETDDE